MSSPPLRTSPAQRPWPSHPTAAGPRSRTLAWSDLRPIDHPQPTPIPGNAQDWLAARRTELDQLGDEWRTGLAAHGLTPDSGSETQQAIAIRSARVAEQLAADPPPWLRWWLGTRPAEPVGATAWDDTIAHIATWRDHQAIPSDTAGLGPEPSDPTLAERWYAAMEQILAVRSWLADRPTQPDPVEIAPLAGVALADRIEALDRLLATAPPDCRDLIDQVLARDTDPGHLHAALVDAHRTQAARRAWILANWPYVVEREQLGRLADADPLGHWPVAASSAVQDVLKQLRRDLEPPATREDRTLTELELQLSAADPDEQLARLTGNLMGLRHQLDQVELTQRAAPPAEQDLLAQEAAVLTRQITLATAALEAERSRGQRDALHEGTDTDLPTAMALRVHQLVYDGIHNREPWVIDTLDKLDRVGTLDQLEPDMIYRHLQHAAAELEPTRQHHLELDHSERYLRGR